MRIRNFYPVPLEIDGEEIVFHIKRMNVDEWNDFDMRSQRVGRPTIARFVSRAPDGPEQARDKKGRYKTSFEDLCAQRLEGFDEETRERYERAVDADELEARKFLKWVFESFVTVARGLIEQGEDGTEQSIHDGLDVLRLYGGRRDVLGALLAAVRSENELSEEQKKSLRSRIGSGSTSRAPATARTGAKPAKIATDAETPGTAPLEDAKAAPSGPSGPAAASFSTHAQ